MISVHVSDLTLLSAELGKSQLRLAAQAPAVLMEAGTYLEQQWRIRARATAGTHGRWYPSAIKSRMVGPLAVEVGPREGMRQAGMSFEFGSSNQPPHLDGQRALMATEPTLKAKAAALLVKSLVGY